MSGLTFTTTCPAHPGHRLRGRFRAALRIAGLMLARARERRALASFDARMLSDIGATRYEAGVEARKPFWRR